MDHQGAESVTAAVPAWIVGFVGPARLRDWAGLVVDPDGTHRAETTGTGWGVALHPAARVEPVSLQGAPTRSFVWGRHVVDRRRPSGPRDAAHELGLAGVWTDGAKATIHTDVLALNDVYVRAVGETVFFSDRIEPLTRLRPAVTQHDAAWVAALACYGFVGAMTPFLQIERLDFGETLEFDGVVRRRRDLPDWLTDPVLDAGPGDAVEALRAVLPGRRWPRGELPLSGGWDSRLIALGLAANRARRPRAWTIDPDTGFSDDVDIARILARSLDLEHTVVPSPTDHERDRCEVLERTEYQTWLHPWIAALPRRLRGGSPVFDGFAGDVLIKDRLGHQIRGRATHAEKLAVFAGAANVLRIGAPSIHSAHVNAGQEVVRDEIRRLTEFWRGHPSKWKLARFLHRNNRVVATSPMRLYAPEAEVILPLVDPQFLKVVLSVPVRRRQGFALMRAMLTGLDPVRGNLRSTNEIGHIQPPPAPRRQERPDVLLELARRIVADDVVHGVLARPFVEVLETPGSGEQLAPHSQLLHWAASWADWRARHADLLAPSVPSAG